MKPLKVIVLVHESLVPPDTMEGYSDKEIAEWKMEFDVIVTLKDMGHEVRPIGLRDELGELRQQILEWQPDIAVNLLEEFHGVATYDQHVVSFLELMRQPYTGCNPRGLLLAHDKALSKKLLTYHRIQTPRFAVLPRSRTFRPPARLKYPLFVKSATEDASLGISQASIVYDAEKLRERVTFVHDQTQSDALVEEYIEGRELYVGVLGNKRLETLPPWELTFGNKKNGTAPIATRKVKWDSRYQKEHGVMTHAAKDLPQGMREKFQRISKRIYRVLELSGYARIDFRLREDGEIFFLEANPNPNLSYGEDFTESAASVGISYEEVLERILRHGLAYRAAWKA
jgi:D-alanine-D-alanine ligase